ncbi:site-specific integrase [Hyphomonas sp.]|uniref:site-specific integrase n=1 Tax=Hyphomonas sp. TaxID=87 RepID=UPI0025BC1D07|nr:site-specific integrase [Hyphomonas sp.]
MSEVKPEQLKNELSKALDTRDERLAKRRAAVEVVKAEDLIRRATEFLQKGPRASISSADITLMAAQYGSRMVRHDLDLRKKGMGLRLPTVGQELSAKLLDKPLPKATIDNSEPGLTDDDLDLLTFAAEQMAPEIKQALARQRPTQAVKDAVVKVLNEAGIILDARSPERREMELAFLEQYAKALDVYAARNAGMIVPNPVAPQPGGQVPTIQKAFDVWKTGSGTRGEKLPAASSVEEASYAVRRFKELHGDHFIIDITSAHARAFRDAMAKVPPRLPLELQKLPLPKLLQSRDLPPGQPAAATINKRLTLLSAILHKAALHHGVKHSGAGKWNNPFEGLKIAEKGGAKSKRSKFNMEDLKIIISQPFIIMGDDDKKGGKGMAARWLPLLGMFTGARRGELAQLKIEDVMTEEGVVFLRIMDLGEDQSVKGSGSVRRVPIHPELVKCGFLEFVQNRRAKGKTGDWLFPNLKTNRKGDRGDAWGRWFGNQLESLGVDAGGRKVYHSFRHTFIARCREAELELEIRFALTGHSDGGSVGQSYGGDEGGFKHSLQRLHREISKVSYPGLDLTPLYPA